MQGRRRTAIAWALSLALHAALLLWAVRQPVLAPVSAGATSERIDVEVIEWIDASAFPTPAREPKPAPAPEPKPARPTPPKVAITPRPVPEPTPTPANPPPPPPPQENVAEASPESPEAQEPPAVAANEPPPLGDPSSAEESGATGAPEPGEPTEGATAESSAGDAPRSDGIAADSAGLIPVIPGVDGNSKANPYASLSNGHTIRNGEGEAPDAEALAAVNGEKARRRVQAFAIDELAAGRVRGGVVDGYFNDMRKVLQKSAENPPKFTEGATFVHDLVEAWKPGASQWAATGNPYGQGKNGEGSRERDMQDPVTAASTRPGSAEAEVFARRQAADRLREFADGRFGEGIIALVEIRQSRSGSFETAALVRSSGNRLFDKFVMEVAPTAIPKVPPPPEQGVGIHKDGIRTLWSFEGRIIYKRKVKPGELSPRDMAGLAGMSALSALTNNWVPGGIGNFDETTGELEIIDLTQPRFTCTPRLVRIY